MWFAACDIRTGQLLSELPLSLGGELQVGMRTITSGSFNLPLDDDRCPKDWEALTVPYRTWLIACDDDANILWGGLVDSRHRSATKTIVALSTVSAEDYLDRRFVPEKQFKQTGQADIIRWLIENVINTQGLPFIVDAPGGAGKIRDREYHDDDAASVYQRMSELAEVIDGPEWYVTLQWQDEAAKTAVVPVIHVGNPRVGVQSARPNAVFELPGGLVEVGYEERYKVGEFATHVVTLGGGEGEDRPISDAHISAEVENSGWPRCEVRKTFDSVSQISTLNSHAANLLKAVKNGVGVWSLTQLVCQYPSLGTDWAMGDDVRLIVNTEALKVDQVMRVVGWSISQNAQLITPHIAQLGGA